MKKLFNGLSIKKAQLVTVFAVTNFFSFLFFFSCSNELSKINNFEKEKHLQYQKNYELLNLLLQKKDNAIKKYIKTLSIEEKLSQIFLINLESDKKFIPVEWYKKDDLQKTLIPAGYIFFGYNVSKDPKQIIKFINSILKHSYIENLIPPFLSIDVEGGFVNRLRGVAGPLPENKRVAEKLSVLDAQKLYVSYAMQLQSLGFNLNLAPVSEIENEENKDFLDGRSYGNKKSVIEYSICQINAYQQNKISSVVKHFPGNTNVDPHLGLPKIEMTQKHFDEVLDTFYKVLEYKPDCILMSHAIVSQFDKNPACLSKFWVTDILRNKLHYDGIVFSDDIFMSALIDNGYEPLVASKMAIDAGINCIMISEKKFGHWMNLLIDVCKNDSEFLSKIEESVFKILKLKLKNDIIQTEYDKLTDSYSIKIKNSNKEKILNDEDLENKFVDKEFIQFENNKKQTIDIYNQYFYKTATQEEKRGLYVENFYE